MNDVIRRFIRKFIMNDISCFHALLINFLIRKNDFFRNLTGISLICEEDIKEVKSWNVTDVKKVLRKINIDHNHPWCILNKECNGCTYGKRHNKCETGSEYNKIRDRLYNDHIIRKDDGICNAPGYYKLIEDTKNTYKEILK